MLIRTFVFALLLRLKEPCNIREGGHLLQPPPIPEDESINVLIYLLATMGKNNAIKLSAFVLLIIGTVGLLVNEFVGGWGRGVTIAFACLNVLGLAVLVYTTWPREKR